MTTQVETFSRGLVIDANILLLHSFSIFQKGFLNRVIGDIPSAHIGNTVARLHRIFSLVKPLVITPHVLPEFEVVARERGGRRHMDDRSFRKFMISYQPYLSKLNELEAPVQKLTEFKGNINSWHLCFTDTSLMFIALEKRYPLLTLDNDLRNFARRLGIDSYHLLWDFIT